MKQCVTSILAIGCAAAFVITALAEDANVGGKAPTESPKRANEPVYTVKEGDTLWSIARNHGLTCGKLRKANGKRKDWIAIRPGQKIIVGELLDKRGDVSLYVAKTESDRAQDEKCRKEGDWASRNSLFMRRRSGAGTNEWQLVMTSNASVRDFYALEARLSRNGRFVWIVRDPHIGTYNLVCSLDLETKKFRELIDGDSVNEQDDGTLLITGKKTYLSDENGEPLGAAWYDLWMTPEGKVVRKTRPISKAEMEAERAKEQEEKDR